MSLLMEALRKAEQAKKTASGEAGAPVDSGRTTPDLSQVHDIDVAEFAASQSKKRATPAKMGAEPAATPAAEAGELDLAGLERGMVPGTVPESASAAAPSDALTLELTPLEVQRPENNPGAAARDDRGDASAAQQAPGAPELAELEDPVEAAAAQYDLLAAQAAAAPPSATAQPHAAAVPEQSSPSTSAVAAPRTERASPPGTPVPAPSAAATAKTPAPPARDASKSAGATMATDKTSSSPVAAARVLAAGQKRDHRRIKLLAGGGALLVVTMLAGGVYVYYEQSRLTAPFARLPPPPALAAPEGEPMAEDETVLEPAADAPAEATQSSAPAPASASAAPASGLAAAPRRQNGPAERVAAPNAEPSAAVAMPSATRPVQAALAAPSAADRSGSERPAAKEGAEAASRPQPSAASQTPVAAARDPEPASHRTLLLAYQAFERGDDVSAMQLYRQVLDAEPTHRDALLGLAALSLRRGDTGLARGLYREALNLDPGDTLAAAGYISLLSDSDPQTAESELKFMLARQPNAPQLHFVLGNIHAGRAKWAEAEQAFRAAQRLEPRNADYAFNLGVSLDQLGRFADALRNYELAQALSAGGTLANFDIAALTVRVSTLRQRLERGVSP